MWQIQWIESCESTQHELRDRFQKYPKLINFVLAAKQQTLGYGRQGRVWVSPRGNLAFSMVFSVSDLSKAYLLNVLAAEILIQTMLKFVPKLELKLKWPNDVWYQNKKMAGMISEVLPDSMVVLLGVGLNLNSTQSMFPKDLQDKVITLRDVLGKDLPIQEFLDDFLVNFTHSLKQFDSLGLEPMLTQIHEHLQFLGEKVTFYEKNKLIAKGVLEGMDVNGYLLLRDEKNNITKHIAGDLI